MTMLLPLLLLLGKMLLAAQGKPFSLLDLRDRQQLLRSSILQAPLQMWLELKPKSKGRA
jgi:hypothetical protein